MQPYLKTVTEPSKQQTLDHYRKVETEAKGVRAPHPVYSAQCRITEMGVLWDADIDFHVYQLDGDDVAVDDYCVSVSVAGAKSANWIAVKYDELTEDNKLVIERACLAAYP